MLGGEAAERRERRVLLLEQNQKVAPDVKYVLQTGQLIEKIVCAEQVDLPQTLQDLRALRLRLDQMIADDIAEKRGAEVFLVDDGV